MLFNIDFKIVGERLLPWFLNKTGLAAYVRSIMASIQVLANKLLNLQQDTVDFLQYTGQHKVMEVYLNSIYDPISERIYITENDISAIDEIQIGLSGETVPENIQIGLSGETVIVNLAIALSGEALAGNNFTVNIPASIVYDALIIDAQIRSYIEASKNYNILTF